MHADFVTIVSGLPRSGTSMMMRMLEAGGMPVLTDQLRAADIDNPRGYYELEAVKKTKDDPSWLAQAPGKAVKMVYQLLYALPKDYEFRVVFMQRDLGEVLQSQRKMLVRLGKTDDDVSDATMARIFQDQVRQCLDWLRERPNFQYLEVPYNALVSEPARPLAEINQFLGGGLDVAAMAAVVEPELYRNRRAV
jgi:hypothetical protein